MQDYSNYQPDQGQYLANRLVAYGTDLNHLPTPLFRMLADLMSKYQHSGRLVHYPEGVLFDAEAAEYRRQRAGAPEETQVPSGMEQTDPNDAVTPGEPGTVPADGEAPRDAADTNGGAPASWQRDHCIFSISYYHDAAAAGVRYLAVEMGPLPEPPGELPGDQALVLIMSGAMKSHWYDPVRQFMRVNAGKYQLPGRKIPGPDAVPDPCRIAVIDTEMERPYLIQFSGVLLELQDGNWVKTEEYATYMRLPAGWHLTKDVARVTGLSDAFLAENGIEESKALEQISAFLGRAGMICGHAVIADIDILRGAYLRQGIPAPACLEQHEIIDTQVILEYIYGLKNAVKLEKAAEMAEVGHPGDTFHDARTDADVTARIFMKLEPQFREKFHALPVVNDSMMHAPQKTELLAGILDKTSVRRQRRMEKQLQNQQLRVTGRNPAAGKSNAPERHL